MLYHHSTLMHLPFVLASGALEPSRAEAHGAQRGLLWLSTNAAGEASAAKLAPSGALRGYPRVRYGVDVRLAMPWIQAAKLAGYSSATRWRLEATGRRMGAAPSEWWARLDRLPLAGVASIDVHVAGRWIALDRNALRVERRGAEALRLHVADLAYDVDRMRAASGEWGYAARVDQMMAVVEHFAQAVALNAPGAA